MKNIELIKKWNEKKGNNFGLNLPLDEDSYVEIGNKILILKEMKLYFPNFDSEESKTVITGLPINMHSTYDNLQTAISIVKEFVVEGIRLNFDFINGFVELTVEDNSVNIPLFSDSIYTPCDLSARMFEELKENINVKGIELCEENGNEDFLIYFEGWIIRPKRAFKI